MVVNTRDEGLNQKKKNRQMQSKRRRNKRMTKRKQTNKESGKEGEKIIGVDVGIKHYTQHQAHDITLTH